MNNNVEIIVRGKNHYSARVTDTAQGTIRSLEVTVQGFEERAGKLATDIADAHKRAKELEGKVGAPFEHENATSSCATAKARSRKSSTSPRTKPPARPMRQLTMRFRKRQPSGKRRLNLFATGSDLPSASDRDEIAAVPRQCTVFSV